VAKQIGFGRKNQKIEAKGIEISTISKLCKTMNNYNSKIPTKSGNNR